MPLETTSAPPFNSPLETGIRTLVILHAVYPKGFDLSRLTWFDHLVVHTADIGGPASLHPDLPHRSGELLVRRTVIQEGINLMRRLHLIDSAAEQHGIIYHATDEAFPFVELMRSPYARSLKAHSQWLAENICTMEPERLKALVQERIGRWRVEFHSHSDVSEDLS